MKFISQFHFNVAIAGMTLFGTVSQANAQLEPPTLTGSSHSLLNPSGRFKKSEVEQAAAPVVDVHTHFLYKARHDKDLLDRFVKVMDRNGIAVCVSLDGALGDKLDEHRNFLWERYQDRFVIFATIDFQGSANADEFARWECNQPHFVRHTVEMLKEAHKKGIISGLKLFKGFGLQYGDENGKLLLIDEPRWDPIWKCCGDLGIPIIMHTADPGAFFEPITDTNERSRELVNHPDWSFSGSEFPRREALFEARNRVIERFPNTTFIGAHFANDAEDLDELAAWLDQYPNLYVEFASRINELGRKPYSARDFFIRFQDRILFGTDGPWPEARLKLYWRFLETNDEYFPYSDKVPPPQGDWNIYGIFLEPGILKKVYHANAARIIPGVAERLKKWKSEPTNTDQN